MAGTSWRRAFSGVVPIAIATSLLLLIIGITGAFIAKQENTAAELLSAINAGTELPGVLSNLQDAETGQRGFLLTGRASYLPPLAAASAAAAGQLDRLDVLYADRPPELEKVTALRRIVGAKLAELNKTVDLRRRGDAAGALEIVNTDAGLRLMDEARATIANLQSASYRLILERQDAARRDGRRVEFAIFASVLIALALAAFVLVSAQMRERRLAAALEGLHIAHDDLVAASANRERLESQLRQAQKMESLGHLTGGLAHDFNNMLAVIVGNLHLIKRRPGVDIARFLENAIEGAERATTLIHRLLAFSRQQPLKPDVLQLNGLVPGLSEMLRRTLGETIELEVILAGGLWLTTADSNQLDSAIVNLAVNARDAMPNGGRLTIETANAHLDDAYAAENHGVPAGQYVLIAVSDSGIGMVPDIAAKAFDPFFTTKAVGKGTGLGLSQVYGFVKQSKGHIKIYSEIGKGTTIKMYLPRTFATTASVIALSSLATEQEPDIPMGTPRELILVVEDEERVRRATVDSLRELQYSVIHATGGEHALRLFETHPEIALLFTDVVMPGMTGRQLADAIKARRPDIKVLYTTGYTRNAIVHNGIVDPGVQLIGKPFTLPQLARRVRDIISA